MHAMDVKLTYNVVVRRLPMAVVKPGQSFELGLRANAGTSLSEVGLCNTR